MAFRVLTARPRRLLPHVLREMGEALHALDDAGSRLLMMVPEQMTLQAELLLCDALHLPGFFQIEVLSPSRFQDRVFSLAGSAQRVQIDTRGKQMALYEIVKCQKESLVYYAGSVGRCGFVEKLTLLLAEIKRAGLSQEALWKLSNEMTDPALQAKLKDIGQLYQIYTERLTNQFVDDEDVQAELLKRIPQSGLLAGARVWVYGFDLISAQFARQLCCMANCAQDITVTLTLDGPSARDATLYMPVRQSLARLARLLDDQRTQWCQEALDEPLPTISPIRHLEQELFAYPVRTYDTATRALSLHAAVDPYEEAMQAAAFLRDCARLDIPFAEMIVVLGDIESDGDLVAQALKRCDIPAYLDRKRSAATHPLIQALLAALRLIGRGWQTEDMSDWLKSGLCGLLEDDAAMLENYMLAHGIRGKRWFVPFVRGDAEAIVQMDVLRLQLIAPLRIFQRRLRIATDANASIHAVFQFLQEIHAYERLNEWQTNLETLQHPMEASDCSQIWRILLETLNQLHALLCGRRLPAERMAEMLEAGLSGIELGSLPPASQIVQIGQLGRAKISDCEVLVLLGMHDGVLHPATNGLLADEELMQAEQAAGVTLGLRGDALAQVAQINLLETLAAPRRRLRISYALSDASGAAQRPSSIFAQIRRIFPQLPMQGGVLGMQDSVSLPVELHAPGMALDTMGLQLRQTDGKLPPLYAHAMQWMMSHPDFHQSMQAILRASRTQIVAGPLSPMLSRKLYARARQSVTRLETFAACPYRQYIAYGLRPRKREVFEVAAQDTGLFYHQVMEMFLRAAGRHANWPNVTRTACDALCDEAIEPITQAWEEGPLGDDARNKSVGRRFCRIARRAAWTMTCQLQKCTFIPVATELRFGGGGPLPPIQIEQPDGHIVQLEGRIDRIDLWEDDQHLFLRVIDYKTGAKALDPTQMYYGLQLQLMLYLSAALGLYDGAEPAGAFYFHMDEPVIEANERIRETIERELAKALRLHGILLSDLRVAKAMDAGDPPTAMIWPFTKDGVPRKNAFVADTQQMHELIEYAEQLAGEMAQAIGKGDISIHPAQTKNYKACAFCDYQAICGYDARMPGAMPRTLLALDRTQLFMQIRANKKKEQ